ncbi:MAG: PQQ-binding-like beta-propeller repeat protein [Planctomycetota bacterium]|nr:PQQ-binding-like beta-propeller repeat protein [Planctomycetota bacterium]
MNRIQFAFFCLLLLINSKVRSEDWLRFRGKDGLGISKEKGVPANWAETRNLVWKSKLPGPGSSSPIIAGDRVIVTCYSGRRETLKRHLVCLNRKNGETLWEKTISAVHPEDAYSGFLQEHGYASSTPTSNGEMIFAFFGKSGVYAFDMEGNQKWRVDVGTRSSNRRWGSASSPILYGDKVIINAGEEARAIYAFDQASGKEAWKAEGGSLELAYGTPTIASLKNGSRELLISAVGELWSINPDTGKLLAYKSLRLTGNISPSIVFADDVAYTFGGYPSTGGQAIRVGGRKVLPESATLWSTRTGSYVATPLLYGEHLYWVSDRGQAVCLNAQTGEVVYQKRLGGLKAGGRPFYASPVYVDGKIIVPSRRSGVFVFAAQPDYKLLAVNRFEDDSDFNGSIAVSQQRLYLRSNESLYCVGIKESR